jgi:hypothetical protein
MRTHFLCLAVDKILICLRMLSCNTFGPCPHSAGASRGVTHLVLCCNVS